MWLSLTLCVCVLLSLTDVSALVQRATALQSYRALAACRKATLNVVATRLSGGSFQLSDVGKLEDLLALLKLTAAADDGKGYLNEGRLWGWVAKLTWYGMGRPTEAANPRSGGGMSVVWDTVFRLCKAGHPGVIEALVTEATLHLVSQARHVVTFESEHPVSDTGATGYLHHLHTIRLEYRLALPFSPPTRTHTQQAPDSSGVAECVAGAARVRSQDIAV